MAVTEEDMERLSPNRAAAADVALAAGLSGALAGAATIGALMLRAKAEGRDPLQPINATSHWLHGPEAGRVAEADMAHTGIGAATNVGAAFFWALPFSGWLLRERRRSVPAVVAGAAATAGIAALVDYGLVPRRMRPGWEHAVSERSVAAGFAGLALGLAAGGLLAQMLRR
jgi:hypothetical protein